VSAWQKQTEKTEAEIQERTPDTVFGVLAENEQLKKQARGTDLKIEIDELHNQVTGEQRRLKRECLKRKRQHTKLTRGQATQPKTAEQANGPAMEFTQVQVQA